MLLESATIAVPSNWPGGMNASLSERFSSCNCFTMVSIEERRIKNQIILPNPPGCNGGCFEKIEILENFKVNTVISLELEQRPLFRLQEVGIVAFMAEDRKVLDSIDQYIRGDLENYRELPQQARMGSCDRENCDLHDNCPCPYRICT